MKTILTILLFLVTIMIFGQDKLQSELLKYANQNVNLTTGIQVITPAKQSYTNFSNLDVTKFPLYFKSTTSTNNSQAIVGFETVKFYNLDFSEDLFNGKIQVYVMGEPLPSQTISLVLGVLAVFGIVHMKKNQKVTSQC